MIQSVKILRMVESDLDFAASCTQMEGWISETREDFEIFQSYDPAGCFIAIDGGQRSGICIATRYQEIGFVGQLIVIPEKRGVGIGNELLFAAIHYLKFCGVREICLDGVTKAIPLYKRGGFTEICRSLRFTGTIGSRTIPDVRDITPSDLDSIFNLDLQAFGSDRSYFLTERYKRYPSLVKVIEVNGQIRGFIMGKLRSNLVVTGPWVVSTEVEYPEKLLISLGTVYPGLPISLGVLSSNSLAAELLKRLEFKERENPPIRMHLNGNQNQGNARMCFAIGSPAKG